jgi:hypothetical protein
MGFCGKTATMFTDSDLTSTYPNGILTSIPSGLDRDSRGFLTEKGAQSAISSLLSSGMFPRPPSSDNRGTNGGQDAMNAYFTKDNAFVNSIKSEYCFYDSRYKYSLQELIGKLQVGYTNNNDDNYKLIQKYLPITQTLNQKLNDLTTITNQITTHRLQMTQVNNQNINALNQELASRSAKLQGQNEILSGKQGDVALYKEMVKYTGEKAKYTDNLITLYSSLNIIALGLLFYVGFSAGSRE